MRIARVKLRKIWPRHVIFCKHKSVTCHPGPDPQSLDFGIQCGDPGWGSG